jgi:hypothetical protein
MASTAPLPVRPLRPVSFRARLGLFFWSIKWTIHNALVTAFAAFVLLYNGVWKIGRDPKRKNFRPLDPSKKLKVGIVSEYYYPHLGGLSGDVHFAAIEFTKLGYDVKLITSSVEEPHNIHDSPHGFEILRIGKSVPVFANGSLAKVTYGFGIGGEIKRMIAEQKFDVIHVHCPLTPTLGLLVQRFADCPVISHVHTLLRSKPVFYSVFQKHLSRIMQDFEGNIVNTSNIKFKDNYLSSYINKIEVEDLKDIPYKILKEFISLINIEEEYNILENGSVLNTEETNTHAWERILTNIVPNYYGMKNKSI